MLCKGQRVWATYQDASVASEDFDELGAAFERETDVVIVSRVAGATVRLMPQRALVDFGVMWMEAKRPESLERNRKGMAEDRL